MRHSLACLGLFAATAVAQDCSGPARAAELRTRDPFEAMFFLGGPCDYGGPTCTLPPTYSGFALYFDLELEVPCSATSLTIWLYDQGVPGTTPNQVGNRSVVNVYTCPTSRRGSELLRPGTAGSPWLLAGSGVVTVAAHPAESAIVLTAPIALPAGRSGVAIEVAPTNVVFHPANVNAGALHPVVATNPPAMRVDQFVTMTNQGAQARAFETPVLDQFGGNLALRYQPPGGAAFWSSFGAGCYDGPLAFDEQFAGDFDLANTSQHWSFTGLSYDIAAGAAALVPPASPSLTSSAPAVVAPGTSGWDEALSAPIVLPAPFHYPGGPAAGTARITIGSNGRIFLGAQSDPGAARAFDYVETVRDQMACLAPCFGDFDASSIGGIHYDTDNATYARVTWQGVPESSTSVPNTFQVTLHLLSGDIDFGYGTVTNGALPMLWGFTPGGGLPFAPELDVSASLPWSSGFGIDAPRLEPDARPAVGTALHLVTSRIVAGTTVVLTAVSVAAIPGGLPLGPFGMPRCSLHVAALDSLQVHGVGPGGTASIPLAIPADPLLVGLSVFAQSAPATPRYNAAGLLLSNGVCLAIR